MILVDELRGIIAKKGMSQAKVAAVLGIAPETFYRKMDKGVFGSNEIMNMIKLLEIEDPTALFFADMVTCQDTQQSEQ